MNANFLEDEPNVFLGLPKTTVCISARDLLPGNWSISTYKLFLQFLENFP